MSRFVGRTAIVTGGGSGIGEATVRAFFSEGASVVVADADEEGARRVIESLGDMKRAYAVVLDVADRARVDAFMSEAASRLGHLDVLVNSAGIRGVGSVMEVTAEQWRRVHAVNLDGTLNTMQSFARIVRQSGKVGAIVNVCSVAGIMSVPNRAAYVSSKHGIVGITREMAIEVGAFGLRVNAVAPGMIRTPMTEGMFDGGESERRIGAAHPIGRAGRAEEVAAAILFLASDEASFISGAILPVDGGYSAGKGFS